MKQIILILIILAIAIGTGKWLIQTKPEVKKHSKKISLPVVKTTPIKPQSYQLKIHSSGSVQAHTQTTLVAEISGKITQVKDRFEEGNYVNKGDTLMSIDKTDYINALKIAKSEIYQKELALKEQVAQGNLAKQDWDLFGEKKRTPSKLALREPHIASAKAALGAAKIRKEQAQTNLDRSIVKAPYAGRILERSIAVGQYVTPGTKLGKLYSTDYVEVRLPLSLTDYEQLQLPEHYQGEKLPVTQDLPRVIFYAQSHKGRHEWLGRIVRTSAALNESTRQLSVIARIDKPFSRSTTGAPPVKIGQFLQAEILAEKLNNIALIPISAIHEGKEILLLEGDQIKLQAIDIIASDKDHLIISTKNLPLDKPLILTPPSSTIDGMQVKVFGKKEKADKTEKIEKKPDRAEH